MTDVFVAKNSPNFLCEKCDYNCFKKSDYKKHIRTKKHQRLTNTDEILTEWGEKSPNDNECYIDNQKNENPYICSCGNSYKHRQSLHNHKLKCNTTTKEIVITNAQQLNTDIVIDLLQKQMVENQEMRKLLMEQQKQNTELTKQLTEISSKPTMSNSMNTINKSFNLNFFLNEQCKDALNISEFVDILKLEIEDLENTGRVGFVEGISKILMKNLRQLDQFKRPIHCSDLKRDVLYIKDKNKWEKENDERDKLKKAIKEIANKNIMQISEWVSQNPECKDYDSKKNDQYMNIVYNAMSGSSVEEQESNINKIVKNITKEVVIEKKNLQY
jgi:hypothetical protein